MLFKKRNNMEIQNYSSHFLTEQISTLSVPKINSKNLVEHFRKHCHKLVIREVDKVAELGKPIKIEYHFDRNVTEYPIDAEFSKEEEERNVVRHYDTFSFSTQSCAVTASELEINGGMFHRFPIFGQASGSATCDIENFNFRLTRSKTTIPPRKGDFVCGLVANCKRGGGGFKYEYTSWFICSRQFLHMFKALMGEKPEKFTLNRGQKPVDEDDLYRRLMSGNRLQTANHIKYQMAIFEADPEAIIPENEYKSRFYHIRSEKESKLYIHLYCAMVLIGRFEQFPCKENMPFDVPPPLNNTNVSISSVLSLSEWHLPNGWLDKIKNMFNIEEVGSKIIIYKNTPLKVQPKKIQKPKTEVEKEQFELNENAFPSISEVKNIKEENKNLSDVELANVISKENKETKQQEITPSESDVNAKIENSLTKYFEAIERDLIGAPLAKQFKIWITFPNDMPKKAITIIVKKYSSWNIVKTIVVSGNCLIIELN